MENQLSRLDFDHNIVSVGKKEAKKLALIFGKNSPWKPMFDLVRQAIN
jgi:hypothetical protein